VPALRLETSVPLLVSGNTISRTLLLVPIDGRVSTAGVAERLARVALARGNEPTVLDLSGSGVPMTQSTALTTDVNSVVARLESQHGMVIVRLPTLAADETAAALRPERTVLFVAPPGRLERRLLVDAIQALRRLDVPCAGVVVNRASDGARV
jgi:Mrp family chromosome partitioning ATPase